MSKRSDKLLVLDIREAVEKILLYTAGMNEAEFMAHGMTVDAVIRNIEVIGEAASKFSSDHVETHTRIPYRQMTAMRNRLIHAYFGVSLPVLWKVVQDEIPLLKKQLDAIK